MPLIELSRDLDFIDREVDDHHQRIAALINALYMQRDSGVRQTLGELLEELVTTTEQHFRDEEQAMEATLYPAREEHTTQHQRLLDSITAVRHAFDEGKDVLDDNMFEFLKSWFVEHIRRQDKPFDIFMRQRQ
jgi:hemerythrin